MKFLSTIALFMGLTAPLAFADNGVVSNNDPSPFLPSVDTVQATAAGVEFTYIGGLGVASQSVTIAGTAGSDCLRMFMYIDAAKRAAGNNDTFGLSFNVNKSTKTCSMQTHAIGI